MKRLIPLILLFISFPSYSGKLFTFNKDDVVFNVLSHIQLRHSDLAKVELMPGKVQARINNEGDMEAYLFFRYKAKNELGVLFVCGKVNEDGELLAISRDLEGRRGVANFVFPKAMGCYEKP
ncbi:hypothetical protein ACG1BZ_20705 [Microbulbifer sp. CNSA002]|uniref:hypothetical protein n=1 Tax=Microbulbifer sp. CNSA002 TaxID=3373604 RepID=UPI0039B3766E